MALYGVSLTQDAFYIAGSNPTAWSPGWALLLFGLLGAAAGGAALTWFANPLLFFAWGAHFLREDQSERICGVLATLTAASFLLFSEVITNEAGGYSAITGYGPGYWFWSSSCAVMALSAVLHWTIQRRKCGSLIIDATVCAEPDDQLERAKPE